MESRTLCTKFCRSCCFCRTVHGAGFQAFRKSHKVARSSQPSQEPASASQGARGGQTEQARVFQGDRGGQSEPSIPSGSTEIVRLSAWWLGRPATANWLACRIIKLPAGQQVGWLAGQPTCAWHELWIPSHQKFLLETNLAMAVRPRLSFVFFVLLFLSWGALAFYLSK